MKHGSDLKFCGCKNCRAGLRRGHGFEAKIVRRRFRHNTKRNCKNAKYNPDTYIPDRAGVSYTD